MNNPNDSALHSNSSKLVSSMSKGIKSTKIKRTMRFQNNLNRKKNNSNKESAPRPLKNAPTRMISRDFLHIAQQKANIIDRIYQERAVALGKLGSEDEYRVETEVFDSKKGSSKLKSKNSLETLSDKQGNSQKTGSKEEAAVTKKEESGKKRNVRQVYFTFLEETPTSVLFFNKSFYRQFKSSEEEAEIHKDNGEYERVKKNKVGNDNFIKHATQTYFNAPKSKLCQTDFLPTKEIGSQIYDYEIEAEIANKEYNETRRDLDEIENSIGGELVKLDKSPFAFVSEELDSIKYFMNVKKKNGSKKTLPSNRTKKNITQMSRSVKTFTNIEDTKNFKTGNRSTNTKTVSQSRLESEKDKPGISNNFISAFVENNLKNFEKSLADKNHKLVLFDNEAGFYGSGELKNSLLLIEKLLNQSAFKNKWIEFRNYPDFKAHVASKNFLAKTFNHKMNKTEEKKAEPKFLNSLLDINFGLTKDLSVNSVDINTFNKDLIIASYGSNYNMEGSSKGLVCLWTIKNANYPELFIESDIPVLSAKFSKQSPNLFACGYQDGNLALFDTRKKTDKPLIMSKDLNCIKHLDAIWELNWVPKTKNKDKGESLITISADGHLYEWKLKKTLEVNELKTITQSRNPLVKTGRNANNMNFRHSIGFGFDFFKQDPNLYFIATEDGLIHRCSRSYKERYLNTYYGHTGPVYKIKCNPFNSSVFLSCSSDWSCQLWSSRRESPVMRIKSLDLFDEVYDVSWNPFCSTVFGSACKDGRLEIWDLAKNSFDPVHTHYDDMAVAKTCLLFSDSDPVLLAGNEEGNLEAFRYYDYETVGVNRDKEAERITRLVEQHNKADAKDN